MSTNKVADLAGPGVSTYPEVEKTLPTDYRALIDRKSTQHAITAVKRYIEDHLCQELNLFRVEGPWRFGVGVSFGSFRMETPYDAELEWGFQRTYLSVTRMLRSQGKVRPYLQVRGGMARLHARSELFNVDPLPPDFVIGDSTTRTRTPIAVQAVRHPVCSIMVCNKGSMMMEPMPTPANAMPIASPRRRTNQLGRNSD